MFQPLEMISSRLHASYPSERVGAFHARTAENDSRPRRAPPWPPEERSQRAPARRAR